MVAIVPMVLIVAIVALGLILIKMAPLAPARRASYRDFEESQVLRRGVFD